MQPKTNPYVPRINPPTSVTKFLLFLTSGICLVLVQTVKLPSFQYARSELTLTLGAVILFHIFFWFLFYPLFTSKFPSKFNVWVIFLAFCVYTGLFTLVAFYSEVVLLPLLFIATVIVFDNWELILFTSLILIGINIGVIAELLPADFGVQWNKNIALFNLLIGLLAIVASFQAKQRDIELEHLKQISRIKNNFLAAISHNLRTPVTAILSYIQLLEQNGANLTADQHSIIRNLEINANDLSLLIEDTINVSTLQSGQFEIKPTLFSLKQLIAELLQSRFTTIANTTGAKLFGPPEQTADISVWADRERFKTVLSNLIDNSLKYSGSSQVNIDFYTDKDRVIVRIKDQGRGINQETQTQIKEQFTQEPEIIQFGKNGRGLGLYITRLLMDEHGGKVWFESEEGRGTTFFVSLPLNPKKM